MTWLGKIPSQVRFDLRTFSFQGGRPNHLANEAVIMWQSPLQCYWGCMMGMCMQFVCLSFIRQYMTASTSDLQTVMITRLRLTNNDDHKTQTGKQWWSQDSDWQTVVITRLRLANSGDHKTQTYKQWWSQDSDLQWRSQDSDWQTVVITRLRLTNSDDHKTQTYKQWWSHPQKTAKVSSNNQMASTGMMWRLLKSSKLVSSCPADTVYCQVALLSTFSGAHDLPTPLQYTKHQHNYQLLSVPLQLISVKFRVVIF